MEKQTPKLTPSPAIYFPLAAVLLAGFFIMLTNLTHESLGQDEGVSVWVVRDVAPVFGLSLTDAARGILENARALLERVMEDGHPPFYFLLLDAWTVLFGESAFSGRVLSTLISMVGLAVTYALGRRLLKNHWLALITVILLMSSSFFVYYAREIRMYSLLLTLATASTLLYLHYIARPKWWWMLLYALSLVLLLYTHYVGVIVGVLHLGHGVLTYRQVFLRRMVPYVLATVFFMPWVLILLMQLGDDSGSLSVGSVGTLIFAWPAVPILAAFGLGWLAERFPAGQVRIGVMAAVVAVLVVLQLSTSTAIWGTKPDWDAAAQRMVAARSDLDPAITNIAPSGPLAHYDLQYGIRSGISLDLSWREHSYDEVVGYVAALDGVDTVWAVLPTDIASTGDILALLEAERSITYRDQVQDMIFYRFERPPDDAQG